ncbi:ABC transporter substrate-binding protein [Paenibacillus hodogayensis]|uniref:ABC transporter substrate-binding protein n=1 Tax=Paenibacillus hodogayensis TaxID=279208 RepID=A0ABV5VPZ1_9BACL
MIKSTPFVKALSFFVAGSLFSGLLAGCSDQRTPDPASSDVKPKEPVPVELTLTPYFLNMTDQEFDQVLIKPLKAKYPHITLKIVKDDITKMVIAGQTPDIIYSANSRFPVIQEMDLPYDLSELVKTHKVDLGKFSSPNIDWIKELGSKGEIYGLPFALNQMALFYNKDSFDKRGVPYPKDGLTLDDYFALAKKMTYYEDGIQYRGSLPTNPEFYARMNSLSFVDPKTNKASINNDQIKSIMELVQAFYQIPGMVQNGQKPPSWDSFTKTQQTAMYLNWIPDTVGFIQQAGSTLNFDLVGAPAFKDKPGFTIDHGAQMMIVSKASKHKEEAFQAIEFFASTEVQSILNKRSRLTVLNDESLIKDFLSEVEVMKGKNIQGALKVKSVKMAPPNPYHVIVAGKINAAAETFVTGLKDVNTLLRETQEESDKAIEEEMAKKKK